MASRSAKSRAALLEGDTWMANVTLRVNGRSHTVDVEPRTPLLYVLRNDLDLHGPRFGCGLGQCGACTVIIGGAAVKSCVTPVSSVRAEITTLEGLATNGRLHPLQQPWTDEQVPACGFCQNGQILTAKALLDRTPRPTDAQIRDGMAGVLCRCMTYYRVQAAIKRAAGAMSQPEGRGVARWKRPAATFSKPPACSSACWCGVRLQPDHLRLASTRSCSSQATRVRIRIRISGNSIRGSSFARTTPQRSTSAKPISAKAPGPRFGKSCPTSSTSRSTRRT